MKTRLLQTGGLLAVFLGCSCPSLPAAERPLVQVSFAITEPFYLKQLTRQERTKVEQGVTRLVLSKLETEIPFLRFGTGKADLRLTVQLGRPDASELRAHDVAFHLLLDVPNLDQAAKEWGFRGRATWNDAILDPQSFQTEIDASLRRYRFSDVVRGFFQGISVAGDGDPIHLEEAELAWLLPFKQTDLCMAVRSRVQLKGEYEASYYKQEPWELESDTSVFATTPNANQKDRILCLPDPTQALKLNLVRGRPLDEVKLKVKLKEVHVLNFIKMSSGCKPPQPPGVAVDAAGGGR